MHIMSSFRHSLLLSRVAVVCAPLIATFVRLIPVKGVGLPRGLFTKP